MNGIKSGTEPLNRSWNFKNITGERFGHLIVLREIGKIGKNNHIHWLCLCDCGNEKIVDGVHLRRGKIVSCGCYARCIASENSKRRCEEGLMCSHTVHGFSKSNLYKTWANIKTRCYNKNNRAYKWYGAKGITMCDEWLNDFCAFKKWADENGYEPSLTIDRINPFKGYCPQNCRWITIQEQRKTTRRYVQDHGINPK